MSSHEELARKLDELWRIFLPTMHSRLASIRAALENLEAGHLEEELRSKGAHEAHKLAGALGTFGLASASAMSAQLENVFSAPLSGPGRAADARKLFEAIKRDIDRKETSAAT